MSVFRRRRTAQRCRSQEGAAASSITKTENRRGRLRIIADQDADVTELTGSLAADSTRECAVFRGFAIAGAMGTTRSFLHGFDELEAESAAADVVPKLRLKTHCSRCPRWSGDRSILTRRVSEGRRPTRQRGGKVRIGEEETSDCGTHNSSGWQRCQEIHLADASGWFRLALKLGLARPRQARNAPTRRTWKVSRSTIET